MTRYDRTWITATICRWLYYVDSFKMPVDVAGKLSAMAHPYESIENPIYGKLWGEFFAFKNSEKWTLLVV